MIRQQYLYARGTLERLLELGVVPGRQRERRHRRRRDPLRRQRPPRRAGGPPARRRPAGPAHRHARPAHRRSPPRRRRRRSSRRSSRSTRSSRRWPAATGSDRGSGGMASKVTAAKIAAWSGVRAVIADAHRDGVMADAVAGDAASAPSSSPGTSACQPASSGSPSPSARRARIVVDAGARRALVERGSVAAAGRRRRGRRAASTPTTPSRSPAPTARCSPRAWSGSTPPASRPSPASRPATCPRACPTRSSTATTSSSCRR